MLSWLKQSVDAIMAKDPATRSRVEAVLCTPGLHALVFHRASHFLYNRRMVLLARLISQLGRFLTGIEIHPGAVIGQGVFIDHGAGVVIGETATIGDHATLYQGVTLGGTGKEKGKRHPTIGRHVTIGAGATVLGPITIGDHVRVGAGSVVVHPVPPHCTVVGVPGRILRAPGRILPATGLEHGELPDPVAHHLGQIREDLSRLQRELNALVAQLEGAAPERAAGGVH